jgi:U3 small nucleolar RNA-associated protein 12
MNDRCSSILDLDDHLNYAQVFAALSSNALEVYSIPPPSKSKDNKDVPEATRIHSLDLNGHRTDVRTVCLSADEQLLATASSGMYCYDNLLFYAVLRPS